MAKANRPFSAALRGSAKLSRAIKERWLAAPLDCAIDLSPFSGTTSKANTVGDAIAALQSAPAKTAYFAFDETKTGIEIDCYVEDTRLERAFVDLLRAAVALAPLAKEAEFVVSSSEGGFILEFAGKGPRWRKHPWDPDLVEELEAHLDHGPPKRAVRSAPASGGSGTNPLAILSKVSDSELMAGAERSGARLVFLPIHKALPSKSGLLEFLGGTRAQGVSEPVRHGIALRVLAELDPVLAGSEINRLLSEKATPAALRAELIEALPSVLERDPATAALRAYLVPNQDPVLVNAAIRGMTRIARKGAADAIASALVDALTPQLLASALKQSAAFRGGPTDPPAMGIARAIVIALGEIGSPIARKPLLDNASKVKGQLVHNWALSLLQLASEQEVKAACGVAKRSFVAKNVVNGRFMSPPDELLGKLSRSMSR